MTKKDKVRHLTPALSPERRGSDLPATGDRDYRGRVAGWRERLARNGSSNGAHGLTGAGDFAFGSVDFSFGDVNQQNLDIHDMRWREAPDDIKEAFRQARRWSRGNWMVKEVLKALVSFCNFGLKISAADPRDGKKLEKFLGTPEDPGNYMRRKVTRYIAEVIKERYLSRSVISWWRDMEEERWEENVKQDRAVPCLFMPETVRYTDRLGVEKLYVAMSIKEGELKQDATGYNQSDIKRYSSNEILWGGPDHEEEHYLVLTDQLRGQGLGWPDLYCVFRTLSQNESMEVGESQYAMLGRNVIEQHLIGFEPKNTELAGHIAKFLYSKKRAGEINAFFTGSRGLFRVISQFDHQIKYVWTDPKNFDPEKWGTIEKRVAWWGGPLAYMYLSQTVAPQLLEMLGVQMQEERSVYLAPHIEYCLNESVMRDIPVMISWGNEIFEDPKQAWDKITTLAQQGMLSVHSTLKAAGFDRDKEGELKDAEARHPKKRWVPLFDSSHGNRPGDPDSAPGRPQGSRTGEGD